MSLEVDSTEIRTVPDSLTVNTLPFVVGFYFSFRLFIMLLSVRLLGTDPRTGTAVSLSFDFLLLIWIGFCTLGEVRVGLKQMIRLPVMQWVILFLGFSCCSLLWSSTASMATAIAYWSGMAADVLIVVMLIQTGPIGSVTASLMRGYVWGACVVAAIAWLMPAQSDLRLGDEELLGANQIGYLCGFAFFFAQYLIRERKEKLGYQAILLAITLLRSLSKTTIIAFLVSEAFLLITDKSIRRRSKIIATAAATISVAALWSLLSSYYDIYTNSGSQSSTLTGRVGIWAYLLAEALQQPWFGHGFDSVWKVVPPFGPDQFEAAHAHNELLQQFYAYGLVGVCMFLGIYSSLIWHIRRMASGPLRTFLFAFLLFILVRGIADTERFDLSLPMWAIVMFSLLLEQSCTTVKQNPENAGTDFFPGVITPTH
jgi:exopolysaccharide production protein ExoQ